MSSLSHWLNLICKMVPDTESAILHDSTDLDLKHAIAWPDQSKPDTQLIDALKFSSKREALVTSYAQPYLTISTAIAAPNGVYPFALRIKVAPESVEATKKLVQWSIRWLSELITQETNVHLSAIQTLSKNDSSEQTSKTLHESKQPRWSVRRYWPHSLVAFVSILFVTLVPVTYHVPVNTIIEGKVQTAVVSPFDGFIQSAQFRAGDMVQKGDVIATLDDHQLRLEKIRLESQLQEFDKGYRKYLALRDYGQANIAKVQRDQIKAELDQAVIKLEQAVLRAPMSGVIIQGDLSRKLNAPVSKGDLLFHISPLNEYRAMLRVKEADIRLLSTGQTGELKLVALPGQVFSIALLKPTPVYEDVDGQVVYITEARLPAEQLDMLRPGMEGISRIDVGQRSLVWVVFHHFIDWLRMQIWKITV